MHFANLWRRVKKKTERKKTMEAVQASILPSLERIKWASQSHAANTQPFDKHLSWALANGSRTAWSPHYPEAPKMLLEWKDLSRPEGSVKSWRCKSRSPKSFQSQNSWKTWDATNSVTFILGLGLRKKGAAVSCRTEAWISLLLLLGASSWKQGWESYLFCFVFWLFAGLFLLWFSSCSWTG